MGDQIQTIAVGDWQLKFVDVPGDYVVFVATSKDGKPLTESKSILISVVNHAENSSMEWNENRDSLGANWGTGPTVTSGARGNHVSLFRQSAGNITDGHRNSGCCSFCFEDCDRTSSNCSVARFHDSALSQPRSDDRCRSKNVCTCRRSAASVLVVFGTSD